MVAGLVFGGPLIWRAAAPVAAGLWNRVSTSGQQLAASESGAIFPGTSQAQQLSWSSWGGYAKAVYNGREYAQIGNRLYTEHAITRMLPRGFGGRGISPQLVEEVVARGTSSTQMVNGATRTNYILGDIKIVTEQQGRIIITALPID